MQGLIHSNGFNLDNQIMSFNASIKSEVTHENSAVDCNSSSASTSLCRKKLEFTNSTSDNQFEGNSPNLKIKKHKQKQGNMIRSELIQSGCKREMVSKSVIENLANLVSSSDKAVGEGQLLFNNTSTNSGIKYRGSFQIKTPSNTKRNARERKRVRTINDYFSQLQRYLPQTKSNLHGASAITTSSSVQQSPSRYGKICTTSHYHMPANNAKKLSKVETLKAAIEYIEYLQTFAPTHHYCRNGNVMMTPPSSTTQSSASSSPSSLMSSPSSSLNSSLASYSSTSSSSPSSISINKSKSILKISKPCSGNSIQSAANSNVAGLSIQESSLAINPISINSNQQTNNNNYFQNNQMIESNASTIHSNYPTNFQSFTSNQAINSQQQTLSSFQSNNNSYCMSNILNPIEFNQNYSYVKENSDSAYYYNNTNVGYPSYNQSIYSNHANYVSDSSRDFYQSYQPMVTDISSESRIAYDKSPYSTSSQYSPETQC
jgi:hypothetical protein